MSSESISVLTPEQQLINRLDDDFSYLLQFTLAPLERLPPAKQELARQWIMRLSTSADDQDITAKLIRNDYVTKLLSFIQNQELKPPFNQSPPSSSEALARIDFDFEKVAHDIPAWVGELRQREERQLKVGGRGFETYFATKLLTNGACAYLAVSTQNEGDRSAWLKIGPSRVNKEKIDKMFVNEFRGSGLEREFE